MNRYETREEETLFKRRGFLKKSEIERLGGCQIGSF
jgi:hypothetical protein